MVKVSCQHSCKSKHQAWVSERNQKLALKTEMILSKEERERCLGQHLNSFAPNLTILLQDITFQSQMALFQVQLPPSHPSTRKATFSVFVKEDNLAYLTLFGILTSRPFYCLTLGYFPKHFFFNCFCECHVAQINHKWLKLGIVDTKYKDRPFPESIRKGYSS